MKFTSAKILVPTAAVAGVLVIGGITWAASADDDDLSGADRDRATAAALAEVGEGTVTDTSVGDDRDDPAYEVEVTRRDGSEVDVALDEDFAVVFVQDDRRESADSSASPAPARGDDVALTGDVKAQAEAAALAAVGGGTVVVSEPDDSDDDRGIYEVLVRATDGTLWQIELDDTFTVVDRDVED